MARKRLAHAVQPLRTVRAQAAGDHDRTPRTSRASGSRETTRTQGRRSADSSSDLAPLSGRSSNAFAGAVGRCSGAAHAISSLGTRRRSARANVQQTNWRAVRPAVEVPDGLRCAPYRSRCSRQSRWFRCRLDAALEGRLAEEIEVGFIAEYAVSAPPRGFAQQSEGRQPVDHRHRRDLADV
jgi:hypothetical protein